MNRAWRDRILRLTVAGLELCAAYTVLSLVSFRTEAGGFAVLPVLAIYLISLGVNRVLANRKPRPYLNLGLNVLLWFVSVELIIKLLQFPDLSLLDPAFLFAVPRAVVAYASGIRAEIIIFVCSLFLWPLGLRAARVRVGFVLSLAEFQCNLAVILFVYFLNSQIGASSLNSIPVVLIFVALSILALALSHAEQQSSWLGGRHSTFWFTLLGLSILLIIVFGFIAGNFATHDFLDLLLTPLRWLWWAFSQFMLFLAEHTLMKQYLDPLDWGASGGGGEDAKDIFKAFQIPGWLRDGIKFGLGLVWLVAIVIALWRISSLIFQWLRSHFVSRYPAEHESLNGAFKDDLLRLLRGIWFWLTGFFRKSDKLASSPEIESVRQIYREVLSWGAARGVRRASEQTPYEYLYALSEAIPPAADDLRLITDRYVDTRYGSISPAREELSELKTTWQRIKRNSDLHR